MTKAKRLKKLTFDDFPASEKEPQESGRYGQGIQLVIFYNRKDEVQTSKEKERQPGSQSC